VQQDDAGNPMDSQASPDRARTVPAAAPITPDQNTE
jgi:hypothetical protein